MGMGNSNLFGIVYSATSKRNNNKKYVGQTTKTLEDRMSGHLLSSRKPSVKTYFHCAIKSYSISGFIWRIERKCYSRKSLDNSEKLFIKKYRSNERKFGYNLTLGGEGVSGYKVTPEQLEKNRLKSLGKKLPKEWCENIGKARLGTRLKKSTIRKLKEVARNRKKEHYLKAWTPERKRRQSEMLKGKNSPCYGVKLSEKQKKQISKTLTGRKRSPEAIKKFRATIAKRKKDMVVE